MTDNIGYLPPESLGEAASSNRLSDRRILIVGGGQDDCGIENPPIGNGRAIAILLAREGATVAIADKNLDAAQKTSELVSSEGNNAFAIHLDVTSPEQIALSVTAAHDQMGGLDGLVYNVGIAGEMLFANMSAGGWDAVLQVNLRGAALVLKAALPKLNTHTSWASGNWVGGSLYDALFVK